MKNCEFTITSQRALTGLVREIALTGDTDGIRAGQFVNIAIPGLFLRRPISVCKVEDGELTLIYKLVGAGTERLSQMAAGEKLDLLSCLGNGYDIDAAGDEPLLIGGGVGVPPMYELARQLIQNGKKVRVILGFNTRGEAFYVEEFANLGCEVTLTTVDGSAGHSGFVTDYLPESYSYFYACGPMPMLRALYKKTKTDGEFSLEERMGCGFGACMGCSIMTKNGAKRVCKDGPVFKKGELLWEN